MEVGLDTLVALAKRRGFIFPGSELYGGLAGTWDYGPLGALLKHNIVRLWWQYCVWEREDMVALDSAILMNPRVWEASGHVETFTDPLVECEKCKGRFRADKLDDPTRCPECGGALGEPRAFHLMIEAKVGVLDDGSGKVFLRPETAQGIFVNFKNIVDTMHPKLPFGVAQVGRAFRNEISPRDFLFRAREFEQMEIEYFVRPDGWEAAFEVWLRTVRSFLERVGIDMERVVEEEIPPQERAHYSSRTVDFNFRYPFGLDELLGLAYRGDYDLRRHSEYSGVDLRYREPGVEPFFPHVIEPSFGLDRLVLAVLLSAYDEDEVGEGKRVVLRLKPEVAPYRVAVFPLLRNKPQLVQKAHEVFRELRAHHPSVVFDDNGNIGKRYRRQDEIGTPWCVTVDFQSLDDGTVTVRNRDTAEQDRVPIDELPEAVGLVGS
ncbi:glycine--tRNA ligase [Candidatus Parcubacteria bacterium]|nr:MAG: glycine--tRNA ligase [Candidatus Parcubacteria bacterium]